jgi:predicted transcriptional regulator
MTEDPLTRHHHGDRSIGPVVTLIVRIKKAGGVDEAEIRVEVEKIGAAYAEMRKIHDAVGFFELFKGEI